MLRHGVGLPRSPAALAAFERRETLVEALLGPRERLEAVVVLLELADDAIAQFIDGVVRRVLHAAPGELVGQLSLERARSGELPAVSPCASTTQRTQAVLRT